MQDCTFVSASGGVQLELDNLCGECLHHAIALVFLTLPGMASIAASQQQQSNEEEQLRHTCATTMPRT